MQRTYDSEDFPVEARKALANGDAFTFEIRGAAWEKLRPHVAQDEVSDWARLSAVPELRSFVVLMALAAVSDRRVRVIPFQDFAAVRVGSIQ